MGKKELTMKFKLALKSRNQFSGSNESKLSALRTAMALIRSNEPVCLTDSEVNNGMNFYRVKGLSFDHESEIMEIILQKQLAI